MTKRKITAPETPVSTLMDYVLQALALLGGSGRRHQIIEQVEPLVKDILLPADYVLLHDGESGQEYAPPGCTDGTWPVWSGKTAIALWQLKVRGLIVSNKGVFSFTDKGRAYLRGEATDYP